MHLFCKLLDGSWEALRVQQGHLVEAVPDHAERLEAQQLDDLQELVKLLLRTYSDLQFPATMPGQPQLWLCRTYNSAYWDNVTLVVDRTPGWQLLLGARPRMTVGSRAPRQ